MREDFLHYIWRLQQYDRQALQTTEGEPIEIIDSGLYNLHDGPDFSLARIRIGGQLWVGNVEIHVQAADWYAHQHSDNPAYANVILHVVLAEDRIVYRPDGARIACLELKRRIPPRLLATYRQLLHNEYWIACQHHFYQTADVTRSLWLDRLLVERLQRRIDGLTTQLTNNGMDWEETFYQALTRAMGTKTNADNFALLAQRLPLRILLRHKHSLLQMEALLFGQAGLLDRDFADAYPQLLQREFKVLRAKYQLVPLSATGWKFMRLRPANFPTIRLAQLATLLFRTGHLFSKMLAAQDTRELKNMFEVELSNYWRTHYVFDKEAEVKTRRLGEQTIHLLLINTIAPFLFFYGRHRSEAQYQDKALALLEDLPAEQNNIIARWRKLGLAAETAYQSQALLELKNNYCTAKRCTECALGHSILSHFAKNEKAILT